MAEKWRTISVFISSTFRDLHAERDHLVKVVFPEIRECLEKHRLHLVDIDLRWGVTSEQVENDRVLSFCLSEIDRCRPFFVAILGQRYGWVPRSLADTSMGKHGWLQANTGKSITELEILHGVLNTPSMRGHAMFFLRNPGSLEQMPAQVRAGIFEDDHGERRSILREKIVDYCHCTGSPLHEYSCRWDPTRRNPEDGSLGRLVGLEQFGEWVKDDLLSAIASEYPRILTPAPPPPPVGGSEWLAEEEDNHERFAESRLRVYVGREAIQRTLRDFLQSKGKTPGVLSGGSGLGKSAVMAGLWMDWQQNHPEDFILGHFVGASQLSTSMPAMLQRLCLALREGLGTGAEISENPREVAATFHQILAQVGNERRVIILIDGINQLDAVANAHAMFWLPATLPPHVKILVSCIDEKGATQSALAALRARGTPEFFLDPLSDTERTDIIRLLPSLSAKTLDQGQIQLLLENPSTRNPLYLSVALEELRGFGSFEKLDERIRSFPAREGERGLTDLFLQVIKRQEEETDRLTVAATLSLIACSRAGLSERELTEILARIQVGHEDARDRSDALQLSLRQLRPYLLRRGEYVDFYHRNLYKATQDRYLSQPHKSYAVHEVLANYFQRLGLTSTRMLAETPHHMREACMWQDLEGLLTDLRFVEAKCEAGMTYELVSDYNMALTRAGTSASWPGRSRVEEFAEFIRSEAAFLHDNPQLTLQMAANCAVCSEPNRVATAMLQQDSPKRPWLRRVNPEIEPPPRVIRNLIHTGDVRACAFQPGGHLVASAGCNPQVQADNLKLWDWTTGEPVAVYQAECASSLDFSRCGTMLAITGGRLTPLAVKDVATGATIRAFTRGSEESHLCRFSVDNSSILDVRGLRQDLTILDIATGRTLRELRGTETCTGPVAMDDQTRFLARSCEPGIVTVWEIKPGREAFRAAVGPNTVASYCFDASGDFLLVALEPDQDARIRSEDGGMEIAAFSTADGELAWRTPTPVTGWLREMVVSPNREHIALITSGQVQVVKWQSGRLVGELGAFADEAKCLAFSPDSSCLAVGGGEYLARGWLNLWSLDAARAEDGAAAPHGGGQA